MNNPISHGKMSSISPILTFDEWGRHSRLSQLVPPFALSPPLIVFVPLAVQATVAVGFVAELLVDVAIISVVSRIRGIGIVTCIPIGTLKVVEACRAG